MAGTGRREALSHGNAQGRRAGGALAEAVSTLMAKVGSRSWVDRPVRRSRRPPSQQIRRLRGLPKRHELPRATLRGNRDVLRRTAAPVGDEKRPARLPAVRPEVTGAKPHGCDLAPAGPAGPGRATSAVGVEPGGRRHHWMIWSARARIEGEIVTPSALAVLK